MSAGLDAIVSRYADYGPFAASFLANMLATFGDKGQLVVVALASKYDAKRVFLGAMGAFTLWSALEVIFGSWITSVLPGGVMTTITGTLFLLFGGWTLYSVANRLRETGLPDVSTDLVDRLVPVDVTSDGALTTSFVFIMFAEFGDKTQLLTITLAGTFHDSPVLVFLGVLTALGLRTGVDAALGAQAERALPTLYIESAAAVVFVAFGLAVLGVISTAALLATVVVSILGAVVAGVYRKRQRDASLDT